VISIRSLWRDDRFWEKAHSAPDIAVHIAMKESFRCDSDRSQSTIENGLKERISVRMGLFRAVVAHNERIDNHL